MNPRPDPRLRANATARNAATRDHARRQFLKDCGIGLGKIAAAGLMTGGAPSLVGNVARGNELAAPARPLAARQPHYQPTAKAVIHLFMAGAPSQLELFTPKPTLKALEGKPLPTSVIGDQRYAFIRPDAAVMGGQFEFRRCGDSGLELGTPMKHLAKVADELCVVRSVTTDQFNHAPAQIFFNSGFAQPGRPCLGSWVLYGLGAETEDLPAFVVMSTGAGVSGGSALWSSGFLPTLHAGVPFRKGNVPILNAATPDSIDDSLQQDTFELIKRLNAERLGVVGDPEIATRIASFEMASRLQMSAPELLDFREEDQATLDLYGCDPETPSFSRACLLARRMVQRGVRFINIYHSGWDAHSNVKGNTEKNCRDTDQATAALIQDLRRTGLLDETLVIWGGEFGRTPMVETNPALGRKAGRDHHPQAYTMWMAGGGVKPGSQFGQTDEFGFHATENPVHVHDLQATILHLLGMDHERLTYHHSGRDFRLTDVHGHVVRELVS
ncbi:MAG: DUF1501 domain-containing protein [Planctomycetota bacterium]